MPPERNHERRRRLAVVGVHRLVAELDTGLAGKAPLRVTIPADKTASYTAAAADAGASTGMSAAGALTVTINTGVFTAGDLAEYRQVGAGQVTIAAGAGVTLGAQP